MQFIREMEQKHNFWGQKWKLIQSYANIPLMHFAVTLIKFVLLGEHWYKQNECRYFESG